MIEEFFLQSIKFGRLEIRKHSAGFPLSQRNPPDVFFVPVFPLHRGGARFSLDGLRVSRLILSDPNPLLDPGTNRSRGGDITTEQDERHFIFSRPRHAAKWISQLVFFAHLCLSPCSSVVPESRLPG